MEDSASIASHCGYTPQLAEAKKLFERSDFSGARRELEALQIVQPDNRIILSGLALVCLKQGQRDQALVYQQQALRGVTLDECFRRATFEK